MAHASTLSINMPTNMHNSLCDSTSPLLARARPGFVHRAALAALLTAIAWITVPAFAQGSFPNRPVKLLVSFPPGGAVDLVARDLATGLGTLWGQSVVVDNRPGGNGVIAADATAKAAPDGHTLFLTYDGISGVVPFMQDKLPYDTLADLKPIGMVATLPLILVATPSSKIKTVADLVTLAKAKPGEIDYASNGVGAAPHMSMEVFQRAAGVKLKHIPYKGSGPALQDMLGGRVSLFWAAVSSAMPHIQSGKLVPVAFGSRERSPLFPQVPTLAESFSGLEAVTWIGVVGPAKMPEAVVQKINADLQKVLQSPAYRELQTAKGNEVRGGTIDEFAKQIRVEYERNKAMFASGEIARE
jgi:tripartite-type tricarboxylate transporter receptor subunit TctC